MHLGIIIDGNRRFAEKFLKTKKPWKGHEVGAEKVEELLNWARELGIEELTIYCFSLENFNRKKSEVDFLMRIFKKEFIRLEKDPKIDEDKVKINFAGKLELLDKDIREILERIENKTKDYDKFKVNFALAYGGRQEIIHSIEETLRKGEEINEENLSRNLWISEDVDLILRTGGEKRMSNFIPWQSTYSELMFLDKMWPEITKKDIEDTIKKFNSRERRFGK